MTKACEKCEGSGWALDAILLRQEPCPSCKGTGKQKQRKEPSAFERSAARRLEAWQKFFPLIN